MRPIQNVDHNDAEAVAIDVTCTITILTDKAHQDMADQQSKNGETDVDNKMDNHQAPPQQTPPHDDENDNQDATSASNSVVFVSDEQPADHVTPADPPTTTTKPVLPATQPTVQGNTAHTKPAAMTFAAALILVQQQHTAIPNPTLRALKQRLQLLCTHAMPHAAAPRQSTNHTSLLLTALVVDHCPQYQQLWQLYRAATFDGLQPLIWKGTALEERLLTRLGLMDAVIAARALELAQHDRQQVEAVQDAARMTITTDSTEDDHAFVFAPATPSTGGQVLSAEVHVTQPGHFAQFAQEYPTPQPPPPPSAAVPVSTNAAVHAMPMGCMPAPVDTVQPPPTTVPSPHQTSHILTQQASPTTAIQHQSAPTQQHLPAMMPKVDHDADVANAIALMPTPGEMGGAAPAREAGVVAALEASLPDLSFMLSDTLVTRSFC